MTDEEQGLPLEQDPANLTETQLRNIKAAESLYLEMRLEQAKKGMPVDMDETLRMATLPVPDGSVEEPEPLEPKAPTYADLMALIKRVEEQPMYGEADPVHPDVFEARRREGETRREAKSRTMFEVYQRQQAGIPVRDKDLWELRAKYEWVRSFVQTDGRPYNTHNWSHFYNRYGMAPTAPVIEIGLWKDTLLECARAAERTRVALVALRVLSV